MGLAERPLDPSPIPVGSPERDLHPAAASRSDRARPKPRRLQRLASRPKPLRSPFRKPLGHGSNRSRTSIGGPKPSRLPRNLPRREPREIPFGSRLRPKASPLSPGHPRRPKPFRRTRSGRGWDMKPFPVSLPAPAAGRFPRPSPVWRAFRLRRAFRRRHGRFREIRFASACADAGAASSAFLAFRVRHQRPWGSDGAFCLRLCGLRSGFPFPVRRLSGHVLKLSASTDSGKPNPPVDNEDNGGKFNLDQARLRSLRRWCRGAWNRWFPRRRASDGPCRSPSFEASRQA